MKSKTKIDYFEKTLEKVIRVSIREGIADKDLEKREVALNLLDNTELRRLKWLFLKKRARIVDVLAFPTNQGFPHPESKLPPLGEIFINKEIARRDKERGVYLLVHGFLHLLGYVHQKKGDIIKMEATEQTILNSLKSLTSKH